MNSLQYNNIIFIDNYSIRGSSIVLRVLSLRLPLKLASFDTFLEY